MMWVCPVERGVDGVLQVAAHFGRAAAFAVVDSVSGGVRVVDPAGLREAGECVPWRYFRHLGVTAVHCRHLGRGALERAFEAGIQVRQTQATTLAEAIAEALAGPLADLPDEALCRGHEPSDPHHGVETS